jgi:cobalt/nickel transport system permease protein
MSDPTTWEGVDKVVVERVAARAGHPARDPWINTDQGDLLLFFFLLAGAIGGFIIGYTFRGLFPPRRTASDQTPEHGP